MPIPWVVFAPPLLILRPVRSSPVSFVFLLGLLFLGAGQVQADQTATSESFQQALEAYLEEDYDRAVILFQQVLEMDETNATAKFGLKGAQKKQKELAEQQIQNEKFFLDSAKESLARKDWVEAADRLRGILKRTPEHKQAKALYGDLEKRVKKLFDSAKPYSGDWSNLKGVMAFIKGDWKEAENLWQQVYSFDPDRISLVRYIERARENMKDQEQGERRSLYKNLAWDNIRQGKYEEAIKAWNDLLTLDPNNTVAEEGIKQAQEGLSH